MGLDYFIREIEQEDNQAAAAMIRGVFEEFEAEREGTVYSDPNTDRLFELFQEEEASVFYVAVSKGEVIGTCGIFPTPGLPTACAELVKFYLNADARGRGIGRALMERSTQAAQAMDYKQLYLESLPIFDQAVRIYEKQGYQALDKPFSKEHPGCNLWYLKDI